MDDLHCSFQKTKRYIHKNDHTCLSPTKDWTFTKSSLRQNCLILHHLRNTASHTLYTSKASLKQIYYP
jgi:hypothetical protein